MRSPVPEPAGGAGARRQDAAPAQPHTLAEKRPSLSVVIAVVDGGQTLERCLRALERQEDAPGLEILVPFDSTVPGVAPIVAAHPGARAVPMGALQTERPVTTPSGRHELYDRRRAAGMAAARGDYVALLEDRSAPRPDWARTMVALSETDLGVLGGGVASAARDARGWAEYFCDYGRYQPPFQAGEREYVSDVNICYPRPLLELTRALWWPRYHETTLHWRLLGTGHRLRLDPRPLVDHWHARRPLRRMLRERFEWGRLFAASRARQSSLQARALRAALTPLLPPLLFLRLARQQLRTRATLRQFLGAVPYLILFLTAWSMGETTGYVTGRG